MNKCRIPVIILYSRFRTGIPLRSKLLHWRSKWWKQATHTTARPRISSLLLAPCNSASTGKNGPLGCSVANKRFSKPLVELLQNVHRVNSVICPLVAEDFNPVLAMLFSHSAIYYLAKFPVSRLFMQIAPRQPQTWRSVHPKMFLFSRPNRPKNPLVVQ